MSQLQEHDGMECRACGQEERASEGYPCSNCGTFICPDLHLPRGHPLSGVRQAARRPEKGA